MRKVLRNSSGGKVGSLLRDIVFDSSTGAVKPTRLSALLNAALGYVAERTDGFVDLDAVPEDGAPLQVGERGGGGGCRGARHRVGKTQVSRLIKTKA